MCIIVALKNGYIIFIHEPRFCYACRLLRGGLVHGRRIALQRRCRRSAIAGSCDGERSNYFVIMKGRFTNEDSIDSCKN